MTKDEIDKEIIRKEVSYPKRKGYSIDEEKIKAALQKANEKEKLPENHCFTAIIYPEKLMMTLEGVKGKFMDLVQSGVVMIMLTDSKMFADNVYNSIIEDMKEFFSMLEKQRMVTFDQSEMEEEFEKSLKNFDWTRTFLLLWRSRLLFNEEMSNGTIQCNFPVEQRVFKKTGNHCVVMVTHPDLLEKDVTTLMHNFIGFLESRGGSSTENEQQNS